MPLTVAALFVRRDSHYKAMAGVDCYDIDRDALTWPGGCPIVAHPPCRSWGRLRKFANPRPGERAGAIWAATMIRQNGGVLEHPAGSTLWDAAGLPKPGEVDASGGFTLEVSQHRWGHRAEKRTWLYVCGMGPSGLPPMPAAPTSPPSHVITTRLRKGDPNWRPEVSKREREATPPAFAEWLVELARRCRPAELRRAA